MSERDEEARSEDTDEIQEKSSDSPDGPDEKVGKGMTNLREFHQFYPECSFELASTTGPPDALVYHMYVVINGQVR